MSSFVFPGSARSHESLYQHNFGLDHHNSSKNNADHHGESPISGSTSNSNKGGPIENPLLFRSNLTPTYYDQNNDEYEEALHSPSPLASLSLNTRGGGILRQRKSSMITGRQKGEESDDGTMKNKSTSFPLPPVASFSLGTYNVTMEPNHSSLATTSAKTSSDADGLRGAELVDANSGTVKDSISIWKRGDGSRRLSVATTDHFLSPSVALTSTASLPPSIYSPSHIVNQNDMNYDIKKIHDRTSNNATNTWVLVFGATMDATLYEEVMCRLSEYGSIVASKSMSNWIAVQYQSELEAEKALCHSLIKLYCRTGIVYFTIQRLPTNDPEMHRAIMHASTSSSGLQQCSTVLKDDNATFKSLWTTTTSDRQKEIDGSGRLDDTCTDKNSRVVEHELSEKDILELPMNHSGSIPVSSATDNRRKNDSWCIKLLKFALSIQEDEYD